MATIRICTTLTNPDGQESLECKGIMNENKIEYMSKNILTKLTIMDNKVVIYRRSNEYDLEINLIENETTNGSLILNKNKTLNLPVKTKSLIISDNEIKATYNIEEIGEFIYKIKYEVE